MPLEYRSTIPKTLTIVQQDDDGRTRTVTATRIDDRIGNWELKTEHPSGQKWTRREMGSESEIAIKAALMLNRYELEYKQDKTRGHWPKETMRRDTSVRVGAPPITYSERDTRFRR